MAAYLSPAWFDEVNAAAVAAAGLRAGTAGARLTIQQVVTGGPSGDVAYWVDLDDGRVEAGLGRAGHPDATVAQSYETAVALSTGRLTVEAAIMGGRIRLSGDLGALVRHHDALAAVAGAFGEVRDRTTYES